MKYKKKYIIICVYKRKGNWIEGKVNGKKSSPINNSLRMKMSDFERIRLVLLGGQGVGKSCIVKRFLTKTYNDKYRPTVEDLHNREYDLGSVTLKVSSFLTVI